MGRPPGTKNRQGHGAGGDRRSSAFQNSKTVSSGKTSAAVASIFERRNAQPQKRQKTDEERALLELKRMKSAHNKLREVLEHPSNKFGEFLFGDDMMPELADNDDNDYDTDMEDKDTRDAKESNPSKKNAKRTRRSYQPPRNSVVGEYLKGIQEKVNKNTLAGFDKTRGQHWIAPSFDPVSVGIGNTPVPDKWYNARVWVYVWMPLHAYGNLMPIGGHPCAYCGECNTSSKGLYWRPMIWMEKIVHVLHQRFECKNPNCCGSLRQGSRTFASIDPRALSKLPTRVSERFEFITTAGGIGIHRNMMYQFVNMIQNQVIFGPYVNTINEMQRLEYDTEMASYLSALKVWDDTFYEGETPKTMYSAFGMAGEHNGIDLSIGLFRSLFNVFMDQVEQFMQAYFQMFSDEGAVVDDTFKYANKLFVNTGGRTRVHPFGCSVSLLNRRGTVAMSRLKFGKGHDEMRVILKDWKLVRENAGAMKLTRVDTDNVKGDKGLFTTIFPELLDDIVEYDPNPNIPTVSLGENGYEVFVTEERVNNYILASMEQFQALDGLGCYYGLDAEWTRHSERTSLLQLSFQRFPVLVINLHKMDQKIPERLKDLLQMEKFVACGRNIGQDLSRLSRLGVEVPRRLELKQIAESHEPGLRYGLGELAIRYLNIKIDDKELGQNADYEVDELHARLIEYAAKDAFVSRLVAQKLLHLTSTLNNSGMILEDESTTVKYGSNVEIVSYGRAKARGCVLFIGGQRGEARQFGDTLIGKGKALVQIDAIYVPGFKPPIHFKNKQNPEESWPSDATLGSLRKSNGAGFIIATNLSALRVIVPDPSGEDPAVATTGTSSVDDKSNDPQTEQEDAPTVTASTAETEADPLSEVEALFAFAAQTSGATSHESTQARPNGSEPARSNFNGDLFHVKDSAPIPRDCPIAPTLYQLLSDATLIKDKEDDENYRAVLSQKGIVDFAMHEYCNKEKWKERVRAVPYGASEMAFNLRYAAVLLQKDDVCKQYWTPALDLYFRKFVESAERGWWEDNDGYSVYELKGYDSSGLPLYWRNRGTNRPETYHQKLDTAIGPWGVGARTGHNILVLLTFRFDVRTRIARDGAPNFGHIFLWWRDRIQRDTYDIFEKVIHPKHTNVSDFKPLDVCMVGIGPTSYDPLCVKKGPALKSLPTDLKFMAERMGVEIPPLPFSTKDEYAIFKQKIKMYDKVNDNTYLAIAREFLPIANGKTIFPKTKSMVKAHYESSFKGGELIKMLRMGMSKELKDFQCSLNAARVDNAPVIEPEEAAIPTFEDPPSIFVPPPVAPYQKQEVLCTIQQQRACSWNPLCRCVAVECGGWTREGCRTYGRNGNKKATLQELFNERATASKGSIVLSKARSSTAIIKKEKSSESGEGRDCAWWPFCALLAVDCGGTTRKNCCIYGGNNPIFSPPPDMQSDFAKKMRMQKKKRQNQMSRERKKLEQATIGGIHIASDALVQPVLIPGPTGTERGGVTVAFRDTFDMLTHGSLLNDNVIHGYLNMLVRQFGELGLHVRLVSPQFYPQFRRHGWQRVQHWVRETGVMDSNWQTAPLILVPIFTGEVDSGHWSGLTVDRVNVQSGGACIYKDSLDASGSTSRALHQQFRRTPIMNSSAMQWIRARAPNQAVGSNDCGVCMCLNYASYLSAAKDGHLAPQTDSSTTASVTIRLQQYTMHQWGQLARRHVLQSLRNGRINLEDTVITSLATRLNQE